MHIVNVTIFSLLFHWVAVHLTQSTLLLLIALTSFDFFFRWILKPSLMLLIVATATIQSIMLLLYRCSSVLTPNISLKRMSWWFFILMIFIFSILQDSMPKWSRTTYIHSMRAKCQKRNSTVSNSLLQWKSFYLDCRRALFIELSLFHKIWSPCKILDGLIWKWICFGCWQLKTLFCYKFFYACMTFPIDSNTYPTRNTRVRRIFRSTLNTRFKWCWPEH